LAYTREPAAGPRWAVHIGWKRDEAGLHAEEHAEKSGLHGREKKGKELKGWTAWGKEAHEDLENFKSLFSIFLMRFKIQTNLNSNEFYSRLNAKAHNNSK
jgi:hypothetical protein